MLLLILDFKVSLILKDGNSKQTTSTNQFSSWVHSMKNILQ
jgi:hypothetical protein